jgi:hypothetical protein
MRKLYKQVAKLDGVESFSILIISILVTIVCEILSQHTPYSIGYWAILFVALMGIVIRMPEVLYELSK